MDNAGWLSDDEMTVGELRAYLETFDDDMIVCVNGYETGYDPVIRPNIRVLHGLVRPGRDRKTYEGEFEEAFTATEIGQDDGPAFSAVILGRISW